MAAGQRVAVLHEDWLNLADPEAPWFSLPVLKRAFPNGLDPTPAEIRAEQKTRWYGGEDTEAMRTTSDRTTYLAWLLQEVLGWGADYLTGPQLPQAIAAGVNRHDVTVTPSGVYEPACSTPVGLFDEPRDIPPDGGRVPRLLVFLLPSGTDPRVSPTADTWPATWVQRAALSCRHNGVPLALVTDGDHLTLVHAPQGAATGWGSWRASEFSTEPILLDSFRSMLHARRFIAVDEKDTPESLLAESAGNQAEVTNQLGSQVRKATELLVNAISRANLDRDGHLLDGVATHEVYEASVTAMMRLVFLLVAEENDLLPVDNPNYQELYSIRNLRESLLAEQFENPEALETRTTAWHRLLATSRAVHGGVHHEDLAVPAYGGNLFDPDRYGFLEGRPAGESWHASSGTPIPVTDLDVLAILDSLLVLRFKSAGGVTDTRRLSYRQVDVEQIGHIYERLLDHDAVLADGVVLGLKGRPGDEPELRLADLEAKRMDGEKALLAFLTDKDDHYVGTVKQVTKLLADPVESILRAGLLQACHGHLELAHRIEPYANLLRPDLRDRPLVFMQGAIYVTETGSRRDSGTAYTTRDLANEVAENALAPHCYSPGPQDTPDTNAWRIRSSGELLELKVCDPAVGSGAILVASCRYLAECLIEAWRVEGNPRSIDRATAADDPTRLDAVVQARRLVAEHCCYGVDRNPMAVEMAKLSMWLTTVAKDRPFTFLDHALKAGDSLLGMWDLDQLRYLHYDPAVGRVRNIPIAGWSVGGDALRSVTDMVDDAIALREEMRGIDSTSPVEIERKQLLNRRSEEKLTVLSAIADVVAGAAMLTAGDRNPTEALTTMLGADLDCIGLLVGMAGSAHEAEALQNARQRARQRLDAGRPPGAPSRRPLHWPVAFPEAFSGDRPGFDLMVGNPPFVGGQKITGAAGDDYRNHLVTWIAGGTKGSADLVAYFFLDAVKIARSFGYLATNTIAQGDTSEVGLTQIIDSGWTLHRAVSSTTWPGEATLEIAKIWATSEPWSGGVDLDGRVVVGIDEMLYPISRSGWRKQRLQANADQSFQGSNVLGMGFTMSPDEARRLIVNIPRNGDVLFPFLGGEDLNDSPTQTAPRWVINFFDWPEDRARTYPECFAIVEEKVKPDRAMNKNRSRREIWWRFTRPTVDLYRTIEPMERVLALCQTSKLQLPAFVSVGQVFSHKLVIFALSDYFSFGVLSSGLHWRWALRFGSTMRNDPVYTPSDVFETFPQPPAGDDVADAGERLDNYRSKLMVELGQGLTDIYNQVHDPSTSDPGIEQIRELHVALDLAVRNAYGWSNIDLNHGFHQVRGQGIRFTFSPDAADEILDRLLELNKERYEAEVAAGLHGKAKMKSPKAKAATNEQPSLLGEFE